MTYFMGCRVDQGHFKEPLNVLVLPISALLEDLIELRTCTSCATLFLDVS